LASDERHDFVRGSACSPPPELLRIFDEAFSGRFGLAFRYTDREGRRSARRIEPHGLLVEPPVWFVLARDLAIAEPRMFRMDRISRPRLLSPPVSAGTRTTGVTGSQGPTRWRADGSSP
jgi:predicted DNA-binding transcriptional regulator YafY